MAATPGELLGKGFDRLDITGKSPTDVMRCLAYNLDPATGKLLRPHAKEGDRVGMDFTFNSPKSVGLAREVGGENNAGDPRVEAAHREAVAYAMGLVEADMQTRVRAGGANENRATGTMFAYRVTHRDTRINADDQMPDMSLHDHVFVMNLTYDPVEEKFKAAEVGQIKHDAPYYEAAYMNRLAGNLKALGYGVERKGKAFEIAGIDRPLIEKFSRRSKYIGEVAAKLNIANPRAKAKLGATTRLGKTKETVEDLQAYYVSRLTDDEKRDLSSLGGRPGKETTTEAAVAYAIGHMFERSSVVDEKRLYETALRHGIGSVTVDGVEAEARRQGLLVKGGEATTRGVLAEEAKVIAFAREGRGTCRALGMVAGPDMVRTLPARGSTLDERSKLAETATLSPDHQAEVEARGGETKHLASQKAAVPTSKLSPEQAVMVNHILTSTDRLILVVGDAGTGKTFAVKSAFAHIDRPIEILAPGAEASRGVLRRDGFSSADTVTSFLNSDRRQQAVKGGVIWVDEAGQLPIRDLSRLVDIAKAQGARIVLQGDPKQHRSVARDGNMMRVLETHAGLPVAKLKDIKRQRGEYKAAVSLLSKGEMAEGFDAIEKLGWVRTVEDNAPLVDDYMAALDAKKEVLAVAPTHAEAGEVTDAIRARLKLRGEVSGEERVYDTLRPLHWSEAERGDLERYTGEEVLCFHRNGGTFKAGDRIAIADFKVGMRLGPPSTFAVYGHQQLALAKGDRIRVTANGHTADKKHELSNGAQYTVAGFEKDGKIRLTNGWFISPGFKHISHGYVTTSHASQGKTVDVVLIAMGSESLPAISAEQFYVSVSRGREKATIYTDVPADTLRIAVQRADARKSATELMQPKPTKRRSRVHSLVMKARQAWESLRHRNGAAMPEREQQRENSGYGR
jgi:conjugative relaxase-like TrwC/TraI family protein